MGDRRRVVGVGNGETDEADGVVAILDFFEEFFSKREYDFERGERSVGSVAARDLSEIVEFDFECEGVANELLTSESFDKFGDYVVEFDDDRRCAADVALECVLATDRFADIYSFDRA